MSLGSMVWTPSRSVPLHGAAFAYATAALSPTLDIANAVLLTLPTALLFAAGYLLRWRNIPRYWIWFGYINWCGPAPPGTGLIPSPFTP